MNVEEKKKGNERIAENKPKLRAVGAKFEALLDSAEEPAAWDHYQKALALFYESDRLETNSIFVR
jgi:hypothetical protein